MLDSVPEVVSDLDIGGEPGGEKRQPAPMSLSAHGRPAPSDGSIHQRMGYLTQWRWGLVDCTDTRDEMVDRIIRESVPANRSSLCETGDPAGVIRAISKCAGTDRELKDKD